MFGIIATIIAAYKGHKTFAWVTGSWTCVAIFMALAGVSALAIAPGGIFFFIALGMENLNKPRQLVDVSKDLDNRFVFFCTNCGTTYADQKNATVTCRTCKSVMKLTKMENKYWKRMLEQDKADTLEKWKENILYMPMIRLPGHAESASAGEGNEHVAGKGNPRVMLYCKNCGKITNELRSKASLPHQCPTCKSPMMNTEFTLLAWDSMGKADKDLKKMQWSATAAATAVVSPESSQVVPVTQFPESLQSDVTKNVSPAITESGSAQLVCASCGTPLVEGAKFCRVCGTLVAADAEQLQPKESVPAKERRHCSKCGNPLFEGQVFCNKCGTRVDQIAPPAENEQPPVPDKPVREGEPVVHKELDLSSLPAKLRRAYIFIEDEEWERAEEYLEKVLDEEPENAYAYLGKAMVAVKVGTPTLPTASEMKELTSRKEYTRAKRFADEGLSTILIGWEKELI